MIFIRSFVKFNLCYRRTLKAKWQERSELIGKLEKEVVEMRNTFKEKENKLSEERDKAITAAK